MKNIFKSLIILFATSLAVSCDVGDDKELDYGTGPHIVQFPYADKTAFFLKDNGDVFPYDIPMEVVGANGLPMTADCNVSYEVDLVNSTAIEGTHFDFVNPAKSSVIGAGRTFSPIKITVNSANLDSENPPVLVLKLTSVSAAGVNVLSSGTKGTIALTLQGTCTSDLAGGYSVNIVRLVPAGGPYSFANDILEEVSAGVYKGKTTAQYYGPDFGPGSPNTVALVNPAGFKMNDVCNKIKIETQPIAVNYSNQISQDATQYAASSVNTATGVITIEFSISFGAVLRTYRSVYTPI